MRVFRSPFRWAAARGRGAAEPSRSPDPHLVAAGPAANGSPPRTDAGERPTDGAAVAHWIDPHGAGDEPPHEAEDETSPESARATPLDGGLHDITKATDFWFNYELSLLERHTREQAADWAAAGLPRLDVADEALDVEISLEKRCVELFRRWADRVRTRVEDAVHDALRRAGGELVALRSHAGELRRALGERDEAARDLERISAEKKDREVTFGFQPFLGRGWFWALIILLMMVDLVANIPIFQELVPHEAGEDLRWQELSAQAERFGIWAGTYRVMARLLFAPDITLLALGVIAFLVFSAHTFGQALRQRASLREEDLPAARIGIRSHRRQWLFPLIAGAGAALLVIVFLFSSRIIIEQAAQDRFEESTARVTALEASLAQAQAAGDLEAIGNVETQLPAARAVLAERERRFQYASGIAAMNVPILMLNLVLALAAALASYLAKGATITDGRPVDPRQTAAEDRLDRLRAHTRTEREAVHAAIGSARAYLARARRLAEARPLRDWEARAERLRGIVPLFRGENARLRGVDPANITAFRRDSVLDLPDVDADAALGAPEELLRHESELERLQAEVAGIDGPPQEPAMMEATT